MQKRLWAGVLTLCLSWGALAGPARQAMVLQSEGMASSRNGEAVVTGQIWSQGERVKVPNKSTLVVLMLGKGKRMKVVGPAEIQVESGGLKVSGKVEELGPVGARLALTGENHRQIGGMILRKGEESASKLPTCAFDRISVGPQILVSGPAPGGATPASLVVEFSSEFYEPGLFGSNLERVTPGAAFSVQVVSPELEASRVSYPVNWPNLPPGASFAMRVLSEDGSQELLYTRLRRPGVSEEQELKAMESETLSWAEQEPKSIAPWVVYANALEERALLSPALEAVERGLSLRPMDIGLLEQKCRLQLDFGNYEEAMKTLKQLNLERGKIR